MRQMRSEKVEVRKGTVCADRDGAAGDSRASSGSAARFLLLTSYFSLLTCLIGCAPSRTVVPVGDGRVQVMLYAGVPILKADVADNSTVGGMVRYGLTDELDIGAGIHEDLLFKNNPWADQQLAYSWSGPPDAFEPTLMSALRLVEFIASDNFKVDPQFETTLSIPMSATERVYVGGLVERTISDQEPPSKFELSAFAGAHFTLGRGWAVQSELGWAFANEQGGGDIIGIGGQGVLAIRVGGTYTWGGRSGSARTR